MSQALKPYDTNLLHSAGLHKAGRAQAPYFASYPETVAYVMLLSDSAEVRSHTHIHTHIQHTHTIHTLYTHTIYTHKRPTEEAYLLKHYVKNESTEHARTCVNADASAHT